MAKTLANQGLKKLQALHTVAQDSEKFNKEITASDIDVTNIDIV